MVLFLRISLIRALSAGVKTVPLLEDPSLKDQGFWLLCAQALPSKTYVKAPISNITHAVAVAPSESGEVDKMDINLARATDQCCAAAGCSLAKNFYRDKYVVSVILSHNPSCL